MRFITKLGRGSHGSVYLFEDENVELVACKSIDKKFRKHAKIEISLLKKISHTNIIKYLYNTTFKENLMIFMEFANYGTLETLISFFKKNKLRVKTWLAWSAFVQIIDALSYLHAIKIIHRDIKPSNILLNKKLINCKEIIEFKICDFSLATMIEQDDIFIKSSSLIGTPYYMAPEIINKTSYDSTIDIWSLGVCIYELFRLKKPFCGQSSTELSGEIVMKDIKNVPYCFDMSLNNMILMCLRKKNRPSSIKICKMPDVYSRLKIFKKAQVIDDYEDSNVKPNIKGIEVAAWPPTPN